MVKQGILIINLKNGKGVNKKFIDDEVKSQDHKNVCSIHHIQGKT